MRRRLPEWAEASSSRRLKAIERLLGQAIRGFIEPAVNFQRSYHAHNQHQAFLWRPIQSPRNEITRCHTKNQGHAIQPLVGDIAYLSRAARDTGSDSNQWRRQRSCL